ncbi:MAG: inositol 2-dehydrogenase [Chloroflexi bacterium RBG_16_72_14]|nr:MAG: inositol 2-dehydrogenase [Chloroflexi bacterium RBG_16_72_14]
MLRVALLGAGRIGQVHARSITESGEAELAWVCDPVETAASTLAGRYGAKWSPEPGDAIEDASVDAVLIASATATHTDLIRASVLAGRKVLCEKPIDLDMARIDACWADIAGKAPFVMLGFNRRFDPTFREVNERVKAGEIGPIRALRVTSRDPQPPPGAYLAVSGGMFRDMTIHDFDMARFFLGQIVEVSAVASHNNDPVFVAAGDHAQAIVTMRNTDGALCTIVNSRSCAYGYDQRLEAFGDLGSLEAGNLTATAVRAFNAKETEAAGPVLNFFLERYLPAYKAEFAEFLAAIREDREPSVGFADGRAALVLAEAAIESVATGRVVPVTGG